MGLYLGDSEGSAGILSRPIANAVADIWRAEAPGGEGSVEELVAEMRRLFDETLAIADVDRLARVADPTTVSPTPRAAQPAPANANVMEVSLSASPGEDKARATDADAWTKWHAEGKAAQPAPPQPQAV